MKKWCFQNYLMIFVVIIVLIKILKVVLYRRKRKENKILGGIFPILQKVYVKGGINMNRNSGNSSNRGGHGSLPTKDNGGIHTVPPSQTSSPPRPPKQSSGDK